MSFPKIVNEMGSFGEKKNFFSLQSADSRYFRISALNCLFLEVLDVYAPFKRVKIKSCPNPLITQEIMQLMKLVVYGTKALSEQLIASTGMPTDFSGRK